MENIQSLQIPQGQLPSTPGPSIPLNMSGFLTKDTIHVEGDAGSFHFLGHFDFQNNQLHPLEHSNARDNESPFTRLLSLFNLFPTSSPNSTNEEKDHITTPTPTQTQSPSTHLDITPEFVDFNDFDQSEPDIFSPEDGLTSETEKRYTTSEFPIRTTRLRSGVLLPVSYFTRVKREHNTGESSRNASMKSPFSKKSKYGGGKKKKDLLERMLRRRSLPVRPCTSYSLFVMDKWASIKSPSFEETSKRLGRLWADIPEAEKKVFVDMALKDNARYKKQCLVLRKEKHILD